MPIIASNQEAAHINPRGDLSGIDPIRCTEHVRAIEAILAADIDEFEIADRLREYVSLNLRTEPEMYIAVNDQLAAEKVVTKAQLRSWLSLVLEA